MPPISLSRSQREVVQRVVKVEPSSVIEQKSSSSLGSALCPPESFCRICYDTELVDNPLISPCSCKGSLKNVHLKCLLDWREYMRETGQMSRYYRCEICRRSYNIPEELLPIGPADLSWWLNKAQDCCQVASQIGHRVFHSDVWITFIKVWRLAVLTYAGVCGFKHGLSWSNKILRRTALHWDAASQFLNKQVPALTLLAILYPGIQSHIAVAFLGLQACLGLYVISSLVVGGIAGIAYGYLSGVLTASSWSLHILANIAGTGANIGCKLIKIPLLIGFRGIQILGRVFKAPVKLFTPNELNRAAGIQLYRYSHGGNKYSNLQ